MAFSILRNGVRSLAAFEKNIAALQFLKISLEPSKIMVNKSKSQFLCPIVNGVQAQSCPIRKYSKYVRPHHASAKHNYKSDYDSLSSSDDELLGHRGESDFWRRKMRTFHSILDVNKDGVISYDDFKLLADKFVNLGHLSEKNKNQFNQLIQDLWEKLWGEITPYNLVTIERYLEDMHHVLNDRSLKKNAHSFLPYFFKAIDQQKTGKITLEDFKLFFQCLGLTEADAILSFRLIDKNCDGKITLKEFVDHGRQFFLTEDLECTSKYFWGPLIEH